MQFLNVKFRSLGVTILGLIMACVGLAQPNLAPKTNAYTAQVDSQIVSPSAPNYIAVIFAGFDSSTNPKVSGGVLGGKRVNASDSSVPVYATLEVTPGSSAVNPVAVAGVWARVWSNPRFFVALEGSAGVATSPASGESAVGLALQTGGAFGYRPFAGKPIALVFKPSAVRLNSGASGSPGSIGITPQFKFGVLWAF